VTLASPTNDLTVSSIAAETIDASGMTTDLTLTQAAAADITVSLGSGDNDINLIGTSHENTVTGGDGDDDISFLTDTGTAAALVGGGENVIAATSITSGELIVTSGSGDDTVTADKFTSAEISLTLGDGDNTINLDPGTLAGTELTAVTGNGEDTVKFDSANAVASHADDVFTFTLGTGTDTLDFSGGASTIDLTAGSITFDGLDVIEFGGQSSNVTLDGVHLAGKTITLKGDGTVTDTVEVDLDTAGTYDFSSISIDGTIAKAFGGLNIDGGTGADIITATDGNDDIASGGGADVIDGGLGADTIVLGSGDQTIVLGKKSATQTSSFAGTNTTADNIEDIQSAVFTGADDIIQLSSAADAYGSGITLSESTTINVIIAGGSTTNHDIDGLTANMESGTNGTASTSSTLYVYVGVESGGTLEDGTYLVINDGTSTLDSADTIIKLGSGYTGTLDASDFTIV